MSEPFDFHGTEVTVRLPTSGADGLYALVEMRHQPNRGPARHVHPRGPETFYIIEGDYTFYLGDDERTAGPGDVVVAPAGVPHRYVSGASGGRALIVMPPDLERYFERVGDMLLTGDVPWEREAAIASEHGQDFTGGSGHWES